MTTKHHQLTPDQLHTCHLSARAIRDIDALNDNPSFKRFIDKFRDEADDMADSILHDTKLTHEQRENMRHKRLGVLSVLRWPVEERAIHETILRGYGVGEANMEDDLKG